MRSSRWFAHVESVCSRFLSGSELSQINARAGEPIEVSPLMGEVLTAADRVRERTGGLVDPGVGGRVVAWGYDRTFAEVGDRTESPADGVAGDWRLDGTSAAPR